MKLYEKTWQHRYDFDGVLQCEFCGMFQTLKHGYDDSNFHNNVIPAIKCLACDKRSTDSTLDKITDPGYQDGVRVKQVEKTVVVKEWEQD